MAVVGTPSGEVWAFSLGMQVVLRQLSPLLGILEVQCLQVTPPCPYSWLLSLKPVFTKAFQSAPAKLVHL